MPNSVLNLTQDILQSGNSQIVERKILEDIFSDKSFDILVENGIFKALTGKEIHNKEVVLHSKEGPYHYTAFFEGDLYILEPEDEELPPIRQKRLGFDLGEVSKKNILSNFAKKNGFSFYESPLANDKVIFVGEKDFDGSKISWAHCISNISFREIEEVFSDLQKSGTDYLIVSQIGDYVFGTDLNHSKIGVLSLGQTLLLCPSVYTRFFTSGDVRKQLDLSSYPVFVDVEEEFIYLYGQKINPTAGTNIFHFLCALLRLPPTVIFKNEVFCEDWYKAPGSKEESYKELSYRNKEVRRQLKRIFPQDKSLEECFKKALLYEGRGQIKCDLPEDKVFWWPAKPSL